MTEKVNLDAFIHREDFEYLENPNQGLNITTIGLRDLDDRGLFYKLLRKPDFQRETNEWEPERVCSLINSFVNGELIPAIILWKNPSNYIFVLDGAHRISALLAWIYNDYGDGAISKNFYDGVIPKRQIQQAKITRNLVEKSVGPYSDYQIEIQYTDKGKSDIAKRVKNIAVSAIQLQWVEGNADKAETSFLKINKKATPIDTTEMQLIKDRKNPNVIAARAIIRGGKGHKYWASFQPTIQDEIQSLGKSINELLFDPEIDNPIKTLDLPIAGKAPSSRSLSLVFEFVNIVNGIDSKKELKKKSKSNNDQNNDIDDKIDKDGKITVKYLISCKKIAQRINSNHPSSLGLHPAVYFYSLNGSHKTASFYAIVSLILYLEAKNSFNDFISIRAQFEKTLIDYGYLTQDIVRKYRESLKAYENIKIFYIKIIEKLLEDKNSDEAILEIIKDKEFDYLRIETTSEYGQNQDFSDKTKSRVFIEEALSHALKCKICNGYLHSNSITFDHIKRKEDGGSGNVDNCQLAHPYCNNTIKN